MSILDLDPTVYTFSSASPVVVGTTPTLISVLPNPLFPSQANNLVLTTLKQAFGSIAVPGGTYDVLVSSTAVVNGTDINQNITVQFIPSSSSTEATQTVSVNIQYSFANRILTFQNSSVTVFTSGNLAGADNDDTNFVQNAGSDDSVSIDRTLNVYFPITSTYYSINFQGLLDDPNNPSSVTVASVVVQQYYSIEISLINTLGLLSVYNTFEWGYTPQIEITSTTDTFYGANLSQVIYQVLNTQVKCKPLGLQSTKETLCTSSNFPQLNTVLAGTGTLIERVWQLTPTTTPQISQLNFMLNLICYAMLRYYLWKLIKGEFDITILYANNTAEFFKALVCSEYAQYIVIFNQPQIKGYAVYFINDPNQC